MDAAQFSQIRHYLGKTQTQLSRLLCVSPKAIQSFEQGWRKIPVGAERQLLLLLSLKRWSLKSESLPCWEAEHCPEEWRKNCAAWEFQAGHLCWFINGTFCQGQTRESWKKKNEMCQKCGYFVANMKDGA